MFSCLFSYGGNYLSSCRDQMTWWHQCQCFSFCLCSCRSSHCRLPLWAGSLGGRHMGSSRHPYFWQSLHPSFPRTSCGPHSHNKTWFDWNKWWQLSVDLTWFILHGLQVSHLWPRNNWSILCNRLFCVLLGCVCYLNQPNPQVVTHLLWFANVGTKTSGLAYYLTTQASSHSPCFSPWDILLHHNWLAWLSSWGDQILAILRVVDRENNRGEAAIRWHEMGRETQLNLIKLWSKTDLKRVKLCFVGECRVGNIPRWVWSTHIDSCNSLIILHCPVSVLIKIIAETIQIFISACTWSHLSRSGIFQNRETDKQTPTETDRPKQIEINCDFFFQI